VYSKVNILQHSVFDFFFSSSRLSYEPEEVNQCKVKSNF